MLRYMGSLQAYWHNSHYTLCEYSWQDRGRSADNELLKLEYINTGFDILRKGEGICGVVLYSL